MKTGFINAVRQNKHELICAAAVTVAYMLNKLIFINITSGDWGYFFRCYFNDLICPIFFLSYCKFIFSLAKIRINNYFIFLGIGMAAGFAWEYVIPLFKHNSISDPYDLLCYFVGTHIYCLIHRLPLIKAAVCNEVRHC